MAIDLQLSGDRLDESRPAPSNRCRLVDPDYPAFRELKTVLLNIDGTDVARICDPDMAMIAARGRLFNRKGLGMISGAMHRCHQNVAIELLRFFNEQTAYHKCEIVVGYGLSGDWWMPHSWLVVEDCRIRETNVRMDRYFGVALSPVESTQFVLQRAFELLPATDEMMAKCGPKEGDGSA